MKKNLTFVLVFAAGIIFFTLTSNAQSDFSNDWKLRKDMPVFTDPEIKPVQANIYQNGDKLRLTFLLSEKSERHAGCRFQMLALYEYYKVFPESNLKNEIKNTFKRWADYMMKYANVSGFGLICGVTKDGTIKSYRYVTGANRRI